MAGAVASKTGRRTINWARIQKFCDSGKSIKFMAERLGMVGKDKSDPYKPMRAALSLGRSNGKLSKKAGLQRGLHVVTAEKKAVKRGPGRPKKTDSKTPVVKTHRHRKIASTTGTPASTQKQQKTKKHGAFSVTRTEDGNLVRVAIGSVFALLPNDQVVEKFGILIGEIKAEADAQVVATANKLEQATEVVETAAENQENQPETEMTPEAA